MPRSSEPTSAFSEKYKIPNFWDPDGNEFNVPYSRFYRKLVRECSVTYAASACLVKIDQQSRPRPTTFSEISSNFRKGGLATHFISGDRSRVDAKFTNNHVHVIPNFPEISSNFRKGGLATHFSSGDRSRGSGNEPTLCSFLINSIR